MVVVGKVPGGWVLEVEALMEMMAVAVTARVMEVARAMVEILAESRETVIVVVLLAAATVEGVRAGAEVA